MTSNKSSTQLPLASILVARFLRSNDYTETLDAFIREAGLPPNAGQVTGKSEGEDGWTIENVIQEKKAFDQTLKFERYGDEDGRERRDRWSSPGKLGFQFTRSLFLCQVFEELLFDLFGIFNCIILIFCSYFLKFFGRN